MNQPSSTATSIPKATIELRHRLPLLWLALLLVTAVLLPHRIWNTLLIGLGGLFGIAYLWVRLLAAGLHATRRLRFGWVAVGDRLEEEFTLVNESGLPALWVEVVDAANVPGYRTAVVRSVADRSQISWRESAVCTQRGQYRLGPWTIRSSDPFGIFLITCTYPVSGDLIIHPPIHTQLPIPLPSGESSGRARTRRRASQATINAAGVRDYQNNDPYRWIHWPTSARRDDLFVRQFDLDTAGDIWLLLDLHAASQLGDGLDGTEEHVVLLAASLAAHALQQNRPVGMVSYGQRPFIVPPARGTGQRWKLLRTLALVKADGDNSLSRSLADLQQQVRRGAAAVILTPTAHADWLPALNALQQRGVRGTVILLDRPSFGGEGSSRALQEAIQRLGAQCHVLHQGEVGGAPEAEQRRGHWDFLVTGTGKVVATQNPNQR